jgi:RimJ/RimL family protein N-acetyltransferase
MTEGVRALTTYAFDFWRLDRVEIRVAVGNLRSAAIPQRLGFVEEGVLRQAERHGDCFKDIVVYSMLAAVGEGAASRARRSQVACEATDARANFTSGR